MTGQVLPLLVVIALVALGSWWYRRTNGAMRAVDATFTPSQFSALGLPARRPAMVLFTAPGCASCAGAIDLLTGLSSRYDVPLVIADVTDHAEVASAQHIYRAPTTLLIDEQGRAVSRISGIPRSGELDGLLAPVGAATA